MLSKVSKFDVQWLLPQLLPSLLVRTSVSSSQACSQLCQAHINSKFHSHLAVELEIGMPPAGVQKYYTVAQGDSLASIAAMFSTTVEAIQAVNPQIPDVNKIAIGQIIAIPQATTGMLLFHRSSSHISTNLFLLLLK